jgi:signal peptidase
MRRLGRALIAVSLVLLAAAALALVVPILRGQPSRLVIVSGHSMDPTFHTGDLVLAWPADDYAVGDVTPYRVPADQPGAGGLVIHRIVGGDATTGFVMQGDNNPAPDIWTPVPDDIIGRQVLLVPRIGELMAWVRQPAVLAALVAGLVTVVAVSSGLERRSQDTADAGAEDLDDDDEVEGDEIVIDVRPLVAAPHGRADAPPASPRVPHESSARSG